MVLTFDDTRITGVLSAKHTRHHVDTITAANYEQLGEVTNERRPVVHNGVVTLTNGSTWTVTGTSYLSSLRVDPGCTLTGTVTVDGTPTTIVPGTTYTGTIVVSRS